MYTSGWPKTQDRCCRCRGGAGYLMVDICIMGGGTYPVEYRELSSS